MELLGTESQLIGTGAIRQRKEKVQVKIEEGTRSGEFRKDEILTKRSPRTMKLEKIF